MTTDHPLISIALPTYNRPDYLRLALASAVAQTYPNIEIVVHDNASVVDPATVIAEFNDPRIKLFRFEKNVGQTENVIASVVKTTGEYVAILGDDDIWQPEFLATLFAPMSADREIVMSWCDHSIIDGAGAINEALTETFSTGFMRKALAPGRHQPFGDIAILYRSMCMVSGSILRKDAIDWSLIPLALPSYVDIYIAYLYAVTGRACYYTPLRLMSYRMHAGQMMTADHKNRFATARWKLDFWATFMRDPRVEERPYFKMICARKAVQIVLDHIVRRDFSGFLSDLRHFVELGLFDPRIVYYHVHYMLKFKRDRAMAGML